MSKYIDHIEGTHLVREVESDLTSGDLDYPGTALEVQDPDGNELFHVVIDSNGERQVLFYAQQHDYRIPLGLLERIIMTAKEKVIKVD